MPILASLIRRLKSAALTLQVFFVAAAFGFMVVSSYFFVGGIERRHLANESRNALAYMQAQVEHEFREAAAMLDAVSQTLRSMAIYRADKQDLQRYLTVLSDSVLQSKITSYSGIYSYFYEYGWIDAGEGDLSTPEGYVMEGRPWYVAAMGANGQVGITDPYVNQRNAKGKNVVAFARRVFGYNGEPIGIISMELLFDSVTTRIGKIDFPYGSYFVVLNDSARIISHPSREVYGQKLSEMKSGIRVFEKELLETGEIYERELYNYDGVDVITFFRRIENGWYVGVLTPKVIYYRSTRSMGVFLTTLGTCLAAILSFFLLRAQRAVIAKTREADERIQSVFDATPLSITLWDKDGNILGCNMEAVRLVGMRSREEYIKRFGELAPEYQPGGKASKETLLGMLTATFVDGHAHGRWEHKAVNGEVIPLNTTCVRLKYKDGYVGVSYAQDMREFNAANAKTREAEERVKLMLDATPMSCTLFDENANVVDCNMEAVKLVGASSKKEYISNFDKFVPELQPDGTPTIDKKKGLGAKALTEGYSRFEMAHRSKSGEIIPCEVTLVRVKYRGNNVLAGYLRDLRELKAMVKEMHRAEIAEESNRAKSRFLAAMSHEIRTPMNVILGVTEIQLQDDTVPPHLREAFIQIYNSSDLLLGIINDILDLSKIEADKMEIIEAKYDLASLINDSAHLNMMRNSNPVEFKLDVDENAPAHLIGDELRIKQVLNNILSNAFKFTESGAVTLSVCVEEEGGTPDTLTLVFTVSDTGRGMTREQLAKLFTEYTRFNIGANRLIEGTGLGMNIMRRLVHIMGGNVEIESEQHVGTTVRVRLPQKRDDDKRIGKELAESLRTFRVDTSTNIRKAMVAREYMPYGKVLIVDDVESNLYVAKGLMAPYGLEIDTAGSGSEAINKLKEREIYDVIFMDHMMPEMDGIESTRRIREMGYEAPIVALTANAVVGQADLFLKNGFDGFISKPIDIRQLNSTLNKLVRDKQPLDIIEKANRDRADALKMMSASQGVTPELLSIFLRDASKALPTIEAAVERAKNISNEELELFTTTVHGMKSALANIGEAGLSQMALTLEKAGKSGDKNAVAAQAHGFLKSLRGVITAAVAECQNQNAAEKDEDPEFFKSQMALIAKACGEYDEHTAVKALAELKKMAWTAETGAVLEKISVMLLHSDFDEAAELAGGVGA